MTDNRGHRWASKLMYVPGLGRRVPRPVCGLCGVLYRDAGPGDCSKGATGERFSVLYRTVAYGWHCLRTFQTEVEALLEVGRVVHLGFETEVMRAGRFDAMTECRRRNGESR